MADRNLLFGILALQMEFITRDQLVAAMNFWVLHKQQPLGQVLQEQGALSGSVATLMGSTLGTPAFMSPEQAQGRLDELGPAGGPPASSWDMHGSEMGMGNAFGDGS